MVPKAAMQRSERIIIESKLGTCRSSLLMLISAAYALDENQNGIIQRLLVLGWI